MEEGTKPRRLVLERLAGSSRRLRQAAQTGGRKMGQGISLEISPHVFHGIEFRGVGWEVFQIKMEMAVEEEFHRVGPVGTGAIPDHQQIPRQLAEQLGEEVQGAIAIDVFVRVQPEVEAESVAGGSDREGADAGDLLISSAALVENGSVAAGAQV